MTDLPNILLTLALIALGCFTAWVVGAIRPKLDARRRRREALRWGAPFGWWRERHGL